MISRRYVVKFGAAGLIVHTLGSAVLPARSIAQGASGNILMYRGNAARTGEMPGPAPDRDRPIIVKWTFSAGEKIDSSPIVVDGTVFVGSGAEYNVGGNTKYSENSNVLAIDSTTGTERWRFPTEGPVRCTPAAVDGTADSRRRPNSS